MQKLFILTLLLIAYQAAAQSNRKYYTIRRAGGYNWQQASAACKADGNTLAIVNTRDDMQNALKARVGREAAQEMYWLALIDRKREGKFIQDGARNPRGICNEETKTAANPSGLDCEDLNIWAPGEPNDANVATHQEDCTHIYEGNSEERTWQRANDIPCSWKTWRSIPIQALCSGVRPKGRNKGSAADEVNTLIDNNQIDLKPKITNDHNVVLTPRDLFDIGLVLLNIFTVIIACVCFRNKKPSGYYPVKVDGDNFKF